MRALARASRAAMLAAIALSQPACLRSTSFACDTDRDCVFGRQGTCEDVGYCSFPDDTCPSGDRFASGSGPYADQCVTGDAVDGGRDAPTDAASDARTDAATADAATDAATDAPPTTGCLDPGNGTTFPNGQACGGWGTAFSSNAMVQNAGGRLAVTPVANEAGALGGCTHVAVPFGPAGTLVQIDRTLTGASSRTRLELQNTGLSIGVVGGMMEARVGANLLASVPFDPVAMTWWRMRPVGGGVWFETAPDGLTWNLLASTGAAPPASAPIRVLGETPASEPTPGSARFDSVNVCP